MQVRNNQDGRRTVSLKEAAESMSVGPTTVAKLVREGELKTAKVGRRRLVFNDSIDAYLERCKQSAA